MMKEVLGVIKNGRLITKASARGRIKKMAPSQSISELLQRQAALFRIVDDGLHDSKRSVEKLMHCSVVVDLNNDN